MRKGRATPARSKLPLVLLRAWSSLPGEIPVHFGFTGRPDRWGGRWQAWIVPLVGLGIYCAFSVATGSWNWLLGRPAELPRGLEPMILLRLSIGALMTYITWGTVRVALKEAERLDWRILLGIIGLTAVPAIALAGIGH